MCGAQASERYGLACLQVHNWAEPGSNEPSMEFIVPRKFYVVSNGDRTDVNVAVRLQPRIMAVALYTPWHVHPALQWLVAASACLASLSPCKRSWPSCTSQCPLPRVLSQCIPTWRFRLISTVLMCCSRCQRCHRASWRCCRTAHCRRAPPLRPPWAPPLLSGLTSPTRPPCSMKSDRCSSCKGMGERCAGDAIALRVGLWQRHAWAQRKAAHSGWHARAGRLLKGA